MTGLPADVALTLACAGYDSRALTFLSPPMTPFRSRAKCSYCRNENHPDRENCKTCGAPLHAVA